MTCGDMIGIIALVIYLAIGWYVAHIVDTEGILMDVLVMLFWPIVVILALCTFIFWM